MNRIKATLKKDFSSFRAPFEIDLPSFCVLTGPNGGGKSQLLRILYEGLREPLPRQADSRPVVLDVPTGLLRRGEVVLQDGAWPISNIGSNAGRIKDLSNQTLDWMRNQNRNIGGDDEYDQRQRARYLLTERSLSSVGTAGWTQDLLPDDFVFRRRFEANAVMDDLCQAFLLYALRTMVRCAKEGLKFDEQIAAGKPPWRVLDEFLGAAGLNLRSIPPTLSATEEYHLRFENQYGDIVWPANMSSGEKTIIGLGAWVLVVHEFGVKPKVLLLDEADAHLHPALLPGFANALFQSLHQQHDIAVVLASHRTETLLSVPETSIHDVTRSSPRVRLSPGRRESLLLLTEGRFVSSLPRQCVLVESADDARFYTLVTRLLVETGLSGGTSPVFLSADPGRRRTAVGGGRQQVQQWVRRLRESNLHEHVFGLVDHDFGHQHEHGVFSVARHSLENYLLDPLVVYALLLDRKAAPPIDGLSIRIGQESRLAQLDADVVERITRMILDPVAELLQPTEQERVEVLVPYCTGGAVKLPRWLLLRQGHGLVQRFQEAFGARVAGAFGTSPLCEAFEKVGAIPLDLGQAIESVRHGEDRGTSAWRRRIEGAETSG